ncbi:hypothetical protein [Hyphococcus lacteus]|uniref:Uncharacterized protein n=1 Tax=Hyphococcus lacteus TaxID=3143536 RepID=A0ABV3Z4L8_9PROT
MENLTDQIRSIFHSISEIPIELSVVLVLSGVIFGVLIDPIINQFCRFFRQPRLMLQESQISELTIHLDENVDAVRVHQNVFKCMNIKKGQRLEIFSLGPHKKQKYPVLGRDIEVMWSRTADNKEDVIELPQDVFRSLFPKNDFGDGDKALFHFKKSNLRGFDRYWNHENSATAFSNKFAVFLALGLMFVELFFGFIPTPIKIVMLVGVFMTIVLLYFKARSR